MDIQIKIQELVEDYGLAEKTILKYYQKIINVIKLEFPEEIDDIDRTLECLEKVVSQRSSIPYGLDGEKKINLKTSIMLAVNEVYNDSFNYEDTLRIFEDNRTRRTQI